MPSGRIQRFEWTSTGGRIPPRQAEARKVTAAGRARTAATCREDFLIVDAGRDPTGGFWSRARARRRLSKWRAQTECQQQGFLGGKSRIIASSEGDENFTGDSMVTHDLRRARISKD